MVLVNISNIWELNRKKKQKKKDSTRTCWCDPHKWTSGNFLLNINCNTWKHHCFIFLFLCKNVSEVIETARYFSLLSKKKMYCSRLCQSTTRFFFIACKKVKLLRARFVLSMGKGSSDDKMSFPALVL